MDSGVEMPVCLSLGELVDRLSGIMLKQWHLEELMADATVSDEKKVAITDQIINLNKFRMKLIKAIDEHE